MRFENPERCREWNWSLRPGYYRVSQRRGHTIQADGCKCPDEAIMIILLGLKLSLLALVLPGSVRAGKEETNALLYLSKYGYIAKNAGTEALVTEDNIKEYIKVTK